MADRRPLVEGLNPAAPPVDPKREADFVYNKKPTEREAAAAANASPVVGRSPLSTRIRTDFVVALKRASLERQLHGIEPHTLIDILEQAIEPWLKSNGYIP